MGAFQHCAAAHRQTRRDACGHCALAGAHQRLCTRLIAVCLQVYRAHKAASHAALRGALYIYKAVHAALQHAVCRTPHIGMNRLDARRCILPFQKAFGQDDIQRAGLSLTYRLRPPPVIRLACELVACQHGPGRKVCLGAGQKNVCRSEGPHTPFPLFLLHRSIKIPVSIIPFEMKKNKEKSRMRRFPPS